MLFRSWDAPTLGHDAGLARLARSALAVDALLGAGLSRAPEGEFAALIEAMNASGARTLAADLPSGLDGLACAAPGPVVRADATVTFVRYKPAHLLEPGRTLSGRLRLADIGVPDEIVDGVGARAWANVPARPSPKRVRIHSAPVNALLRRTQGPRYTWRKTRSNSGQIQGMNALLTP